MIDLASGIKRHLCDGQPDGVRSGGGIDLISVDDEQPVRLDGGGKLSESLLA